MAIYIYKDGYEMMLMALWNVWNLKLHKLGYHPYT